MIGVPAPLIANDADWLLELQDIVRYPPLPLKLSIFGLPAAGCGLTHIVNVPTLSVLMSVKRLSIFA
jgi:hypothetical protein